MSPAASATSSSSVAVAAAAPSSSGGGGGGGSGGFQYKPPSYLLRASDTTNRPWNGNGTENGNDVRSSSNDENEYDLPQEQRPQTRRESYVDAHFHQRVRTKQSRYRDIITGETAEGNSNSSSSSSSSNQHAEQQQDDDDDDDDSVLIAAANVDSLDSFSRVRSEKQHLTQASENNTARLNRKERITGITKPNPMKLRSSSSAPVDAETVRSLRAQRLRSNLLKSSSDEFDLQTKLESRRIQSRKDEQNERVASSSTATSLASTSDITSSELSSSSSSVQQQQKYELDKERKAIQLERKALIIAAKKEAASYALQRASQINNERRKQRELNAIIEMNRIEDEKYLKRRSNEQQQQQRIRNSSRNSSSSSSSSRNRSNNNNNNNNNNNKYKTMKTKSFFNNDCGNGANGNDDDMTIFDLDNDFAFLNDISGIVRDSGLMRGCLSVTTGCFGTTTNSGGGNDINDCYGNDIALCTSTTTAAAAAAADDDDDDDIIIDTNNTARSTRTCTRTCTPDLVPCSDTSSSDIEEGDNNNNNNNNINNCDGNDDNGNNDNDNNSLRRSRLYAKYRA